MGKIVRNFIALIILLSLTSCGCSSETNVDFSGIFEKDEDTRYLPVIGKRTVFDVDVEELSGLCLNKDKTALLSAFATEVAGMCYDPVDDRLWIVDSNEAELYLVTVDGKLEATYSLGKIENAESVCLDIERGCIWVGSDEYSPKLYRYEISF